MTNITRRTALIGLAATAFGATAAQAASHGGGQAVAIKGMAFQPASVTVKAGTPVTFTNQDGAPHTATAAAGNWDTGRLRKGQSATVTFDRPGSYSYYCKVHPGMKGVIVVE